MIDCMDVNATLMATELFKGLSGDQIALVARACREGSCKAGEIIFDEGAEGDDLFVLSEGRVSIEIKMIRDTTSEKIHQVKDHEIFGEFALIDGHKRSARTKALDNLDMIIVDCKMLRMLMEENHDLGYAIMGNLARILARKVRDTNLSLRNSLMQQKYIFGEFS